MSTATDTTVALVPAAVAAAPRRPGTYAVQMLEWEELTAELGTIVRTLDAVGVPVTLEIARDGGRPYGVRVVVDLPQGEAGR